MIGKSHLVDSLTRLGVKVAVIFGPEHGFRGTVSAGKVGNHIDEATEYLWFHLRRKRRPSEEDVKDVIMLYDIQDVGVRFYTYILHAGFMEAAFEYGKPLIILTGLIKRILCGWAGT